MYDTSKVKKFYHGTVESVLPSIMEKGLMAARQPRMGASAYFPEYHYDEVGAVALTDAKQRGFYYALVSAMADAQRKNLKAMPPSVVIEVEPSLLNSPSLFIRMPSDDKRERSNEFDYYNDIPAKALNAYLKFDDKAKEWRRRKI